MKKLILFFILGFLLFGLLVYTHEIVHKTIFSYYGIDSKITFQNGTFVTIGKGCVNDCLLVQSINEVIGYTMLPIFTLIFLGFIFLIDKEEK